MQNRYRKPFIFNMFQVFRDHSRSVETGEIPGDSRNNGISGYPHLWRNMWITSGWPQKRVSRLTRKISLWIPKSYPGGWPVDKLLGGRTA
jgi:hypothetical protein